MEAQQTSDGMSPTRSLMVDIDQEKRHWMRRYKALPRASAIRSFVRYWPILYPAYDAYLRKPHAPATEILADYLRHEYVVRSPLSRGEATHVFTAVWARITDQPAAALCLTRAMPAITNPKSGPDRH